MRPMRNHQADWQPPTNIIIIHYHREATVLRRTPPCGAYVDAFLKRTPMILQTESMKSSCVPFSGNSAP